MTCQGRPSIGTWKCTPNKRFPGVTLFCFCAIKILRARPWPGETKIRSCTLCFEWREIWDLTTPHRSEHAVCLRKKILNTLYKTKTSQKSKKSCLFTVFIPNRWKHVRIQGLVGNTDNPFKSIVKTVNTPPYFHYSCPSPKEKQTIAHSFSPLQPTTLRCHTMTTNIKCISIYLSIHLI